MILVLLIIGIEVILYMDLAALGAVLVTGLMNWSMKRSRFKSVSRTF